MISISLKSLADYMTSGAVRQRKILHDSKYPDAIEAKAKIKYYREARDAVSAYHRNKHPSSWLFEKARWFEVLASSSSEMVATRLKHNARAVRAYEKHFQSKAYDVLKSPSWELTYSGVRITIHPDLHVIEKGISKIIRFDFNVNELNDEAIRIMSQCLFEAQIEYGLDLPSSAVLFVDVMRGKVYKGARLGSKRKNEIQAACMSIAAIWPGI